MSPRSPSDRCHLPSRLDDLPEPPPCISTSAARKPKPHFVLAIIAGLLFAGCDASHPPLDTAPLAETVTADVTPANLAIEFGMDANPAPSVEAARATDLGGPIGGLDAADLARFNDGRDEFEDEDDIEEGLGPVFNENSCATCHSGPVGGTSGRLETRFGRWGSKGFDPLAQLGGSLMQDHAIGEVRHGDESYIFVPEVVPPQANVTAKRLTTPLFGLGLVDAVTDAALLELAALEARNTPATAGTPHMVTEVHTGATRVGRFGWKCQVPTLHQFSGDAYLNEMGVTNPDFPIENAPQGDAQALQHNPKPELNDEGGENVEQFFDFMTLLGPPPRGHTNPLAREGAMVFAKIGCANCHAPSLVSGDSKVPALSRKTFHPFSDFLLHDMGSLGDGIVQGQANGRQMRTAPLWGLRFRKLLLHDGRARTPQGAVLYHDGQARDARRNFYRLRGREHAALEAFLRSL
jgi:di-heme oxidoreductase (putative peroxidase)